MPGYIYSINSLVKDKLSAYKYSIIYYVRANYEYMFIVKSKIFRLPGGVRVDFESRRGAEVQKG